MAKILELENWKLLNRIIYRIIVISKQPQDLFFKECQTLIEQCDSGVFNYDIFSILNRADVGKIIMLYKNSTGSGDDFLDLITERLYIKVDETK